MQSRPNTLLLSLGEEYDIQKLGEVLNLPKVIQERGIKHVIVDAHALQRINVMGLEISALKDSLPSSTEHSLVFVGLKPETAQLFSLLDSEKRYGGLLNFESVEEALAFLNTPPINRPQPAAWG